MKYYQNTLPSFTWAPGIFRSKSKSQIGSVCGGAVGCGRRKDPDSGQVKRKGNVDLLGLWKTQSHIPA